MSLKSDDLTDDLLVNIHLGKEEDIRRIRKEVNAAGYLVDVAQALLCAKVIGSHLYFFEILLLKALI